MKIGSLIENICRRYGSVYSRNAI